MDIRDRVRAWMEEQRMLGDTETLLCALSGGADSVCLLHILRGLAPELGFRLEAAHFHHGIRGQEADRDRDFAAALCRDWSIPLHLGHGDAPAWGRERGLSLETAARELRYAFLEETAEALPKCRIATAHQAEDNAETLLLHLLRGTGLSGLRGIPPVRGRVIRPLLPVSREEVLAYLAERDLPHVEDSTNALEEGERNLLRHRVLPVLRELNPAFPRMMLNTAALLREDERCLNTLAAELMEGTSQSSGLRETPDARSRCGSVRRGSDVPPARHSLPRPCFAAPKGEPAASAGWGIASPLGEVPQCAHWGGEVLYSCRKLLSVPVPLSSRALRLGAEELGVSLERKHVSALLDLAAGSGGLAGLDLPGGLRASREFDLLRLRRWEEDRAPYDIPLEYGVWTELPPLGRRVWWGPAAEAGKVHGKFQTFFFKNACICGSIHVRSRRAGDSLRLTGRNGSKTLKKWMIEGKIPALDRALWPVFADDLGVVAVPGLGTAERAAAPAEAADGAILLSERKDHAGSEISGNADQRGTDRG